MAEYVERHANVWPEMRDALRDAGWGNYSLFLSSDGTLIGYLEVDDFESALATMSAKKVNTLWQAEMAEYFVGIDGAPDESISPLTEIFHLD
jgi:L-rhamnose mutarotase